jgi:pimeloyl-ACP methyl ester carboxylesterase
LKVRVASKDAATRETDAAANGRGGSLWPFVAGIVAGASGAMLAYALTKRRPILDPRLVHGAVRDPDVPLTVLVPGIMGSELLRPGGERVWLNLGNAIGSHDLSLPFTLPLCDSRDDLVPGDLIGADTFLPRMFGFTEYADAIELLEGAGFARGRADGGPAYHVFTYDWRRDIVESARALEEELDALAEARGDPDARFNVIGHSMGGLIARYYLRYGGTEPTEDAPVTWAGARRIRNLILVAVPNGGSIPALDAILNGNRVGMSYTTLAAEVIGRMPAIYALLPPNGAAALADGAGEPLAVDLHDPGVWERLGWGPFAPYSARRRNDPWESRPERAAHREFVSAALQRAGAVHRALARTATTPCPSRVVLLGGDCLPTLARAIVPNGGGVPPRFEPASARDAAAMYEAGDGRVTRASALASHLPGAEDTDTGTPLPEVSQVFFGAADHHGIYREATFQSILLRMLLRSARPRPRLAPRDEERLSALEPSDDRGDRPPR